MGGYVAAVGCGARGGSEVNSDQRGTLRGEVRLTGIDPAVMVTLQMERGRWVNLIGELRDELERLAGATVAVDGEPRGEWDFEVTGYEILTIQGLEPWVGILSERDGIWWLDGNRRVRLVEVPARFRELVGARVWILGRAIGDGVHPQTYGVIRPPEP